MFYDSRWTTNADPSAKTLQLNRWVFTKAGIQKAGRPGYGIKSPFSRASYRREFVFHWVVAGLLCDEISKLSVAVCLSIRRILIWFFSQSRQPPVGRPYAARGVANGNPTRCTAYLVSPEPEMADWFTPRGVRDGNLLKVPGASAHYSPV